MLGQGCLRALFGKQFPPPESGLEMGFCQCPEVGPKRVKTWILTHVHPLLHPKSHFPSTKTHLKATLTEKSTLWTDAGVDQNFQRDLRAIGPCEFQGNSYLPMAPALFSGKNSHGPMALKVRQKLPPTLVLVHGWLFPV